MRPIECGTSSTGISIKKIHNLVMAESLKSRIKVIQSIGRALRKHHTKDKVFIYDIADKIPYIDRFRKNSYSYDHLLKRIEYYYYYEFPYKFKKYDIYE